MLFTKSWIVWNDYICFYLKDYTAFGRGRDSAMERSYCEKTTTVDRPIVASASRAPRESKGERATTTLLSPSATIAENLSVLAWNERPCVRPSDSRSVVGLRAGGRRSESHGRTTLSIYSFANAICRRRLFESITPSELLRSADVGACNRRRPPARPSARLTS